MNNITSKTIKLYKSWLKNKGLSSSSINRKLISLNKFLSWAEESNYILANPLKDNKKKIIIPLFLKHKKKNAKLFIFSVTTIAIMALLLAWFLSKRARLLQQLVSKTTEQPAEQLTVSQAGYSPWIIFYKGRITTSQGQTITSKADATFKIYDSPQAGQPLWTSKVWQLEPDAEGNFFAPLGDTTRGDHQIPSQLFFQNDKLYVSVIVNNDELTPRLPVSTAGHSADAYLLQEHPPAEQAGPGNVPVLDSKGQFTLAAATPKIKALNDTFSIEGQAITLETPFTSDGDITLNPDGEGTVKLLLSNSQYDSLYIHNANLYDGNLISGWVANSTTNFNLISLSAGAFKQELFVVSGTGDMQLAGDADIQGTLTVVKDVNLGQYLYHQNDKDTFVNFETNSIEMEAGGLGFLQLKKGTDPSTLTGNYNNDDIDFHWYGDTNTGLFFIDSSEERIGIGTTTPEHLLDVKGSTQIGGDLRVDNQLRLGRYDTNPTSAIGEGTIIYNRTDDTIYYYDGTSWTQITSSTDSLWQRNSSRLSPINITDDIGIGTTNPGAALEVLETTEQLRLSYDTSNYVAFTTDSSGDITIYPNEGTGGLKIIGHATSPNIVSGYSGNSIASGVYGSSILGGGESSSVNSVISGNHSTIIGGKGNTINTSHVVVNSSNLIGSGINNSISSTYTLHSSVIVGGQQNAISDQASESFIGGGYINTISGWGSYNFIGGGSGNVASSDSGYATIVGGQSNTAAHYAFTGGGTNNVASGYYTVISGGGLNIASGYNATIPGGRSNTASGDYSFATGRRAKATAQGAFALTDSTDADFTVGTADVFGTRFSGGYWLTGGNVSIGTSAPTSGYKLDINPGTGNALNLGTIDQNAQKGINIAVSADSDGVYPYGLYNTIGVGTGTPGGFRIPSGVYNEISVETTGVGSISFPRGVYNYFKATTMGTNSQIAGVYTASDSYSTEDITVQDANYISLKAGGASSKARGARTEIWLKNDDDLMQIGYGNDVSLHAMGTNDIFRGLGVDDTDSGVTGGASYGVYIDLDDTDSINFGIYEKGGATNYFAGNVGIGTSAPSEVLDVVGDLEVSGVGQFGGIIGTAYNAISDSGTTSHSLASDDDLFVEGDLEINGTLYTDGAISMASNITMAEDTWIGIGASSERIVFDGSGNFLGFYDTSLRVYDSTDTDYIDIAHDGTDVNITTSGTGEVNLDNDLDLALTLKVGTGASNDDDYIYFDDGSTEYLMWDDNPGEFILTDDLNIANHLAVGADGAVATDRIIDIDETFTANANQYGIVLEPTFNFTVTGTRYAYGLYLDAISDDIEANGNTAMLYGTYSNFSITDGSSSGGMYAYGSYSSVNSTHTSGTVTQIFGSRSLAVNNSTGTLNYIYGTYSIAKNDGDGNLIVGGYFKAQNANTISSSDWKYAGVQAVVDNDAYRAGLANPVESWIDNAAAGVITTGSMLYVDLINAGTIGTTYGIYINDIIEGTQTNAYGIWANEGDWVLDEDGDGIIGGTGPGGDIFIGESADLELYHDGTNSYITNNTGDFYVGDAATDDLILQNNGGNVGVGTTAPSQTLDVAGDMLVGSDATDNDDYLYFDTGTSEYLAWDDSPGEFILSDDLDVAGHAALGVSGAVTTTTVLDIDETLTTETTKAVVIEPTFNFTATQHETISGVNIDAQANDIDPDVYSVTLNSLYARAYITEGSPISTATGIVGLSQALHTTDSLTYMYGVTGQAINDSTANVYYLYGVKGSGRNDGLATDVYGGHFTAQNTTTVSDAANYYGVYSLVNNDADTATNARAFYGEINNATSVNITTGSGLYLDLVNAGTIGTTYGIYINDIIEGTQTNAYGIWANEGDWVLDDDGDGTIGGTGGGDLFIGEGADLELYHDSTNSYIMNNTGDLYIGDAATDDVILSANGGNVGIGATSPQQKLHVLRTDDGAPVRFEDSDGYCEINPTTTTWSCTSDERMKKDIITIDNALDKVMALRGVNFRWNTQDSDQYRIGFIAQEVQQVIPEMVYEDEKGFLSVGTGSLIPILTNAVQEQQQQIKQSNLFSNELNNLSLDNQSAINQIDNLNLSLVVEKVNSLYEFKDQMQAYNNHITLLDEIIIDPSNDVVLESDTYDGIVVKNQTTGQVFDKLIAGAQGVFAQLKTGFVETTKLVANTIEAGVATIQKINTKELFADEKIISPLVETDEIRIKNERLKIKNNQGEEVASINSDGQSKFKKLLTDKIETKEIKTEKLDSETATIAGDLSASKGFFKEIFTDKIEVDIIEGLEAKIASIASYSIDSLDENELLDVVEQASESALIADLLEEGSSITNYDYLDIASIDTNSLIVNDLLAVLGQATITSLEVTNGLIVQDSLMITQTSIGNTQAKLYVQPLGIGGIDLMAGAFVIDETGDIYINADVYIDGKLSTKDLEAGTASVSESMFASLLKPLPDRDLEVNLNDSQQFEISNDTLDTVASIDASGSATFKKLNIASAHEATSSADFGQIIKPEITTNATAGQAILPAGAKELVINNSNITAKSLVYITPTSDTENKVLYIKNKKDGDDGYFTIAIDQSILKEIKFNWWIIN